MFVKNMYNLNTKRARVEENGVIEWISGSFGSHVSYLYPESDLVEIVEIPNLKWFIGTQFHPEYSSTVLSPHPLFLDFVKTAIANQTSEEA